MGISTNEAVNTALKRDYRKTKARFLRKGPYVCLCFRYQLWFVLSAFLTVGEAWGVWNEFWALPIAGTIIGYCLLSAVGSGLK